MQVPKLNDVEARLLGVLIEKALTTPEQYPLSLLALRNGANQKSNRDPVTDFVEAEVVVGLQGLVPKHLAGKVHSAGSRVDKYRHTAKETLGVGDGELAILAELLMRGPQAQGELRSRVDRMVPTPTLADLQMRLEALLSRDLVVRVSPAAGSRATRYAQTLRRGSEETLPSVATTAAAPSAPRAVAPTPEAAPAGDLAARVEALEREVRDLRETVELLLAAQD